MSKMNTLTKKVAKVPVVMQLEMLECGAACLTMILAYYDKWIPLEQVRSDCGVSRDGSNARNVVKAARNYGLDAKAFKAEPEALKKNGMFPCIIHWNFNHFVVLKGFRGDKAYINDPDRGEIAVSMQEFDESFTGVFMVFEPGENFVPSGKKRSVLGNVLLRLKGVGVAVAFVVLTTIISNLIGIISPGFTRVFYDRLLTGKNTDWAPWFVLGLLMLYIIQILVEWVRAVYSLKINGKIAVVGSTSFMWKALRMPMEFFSQRMVGDILSRESSIAGISQILVNTFAPLVLDLAMGIFYFVVMVRYSLLLTAVGLTSLVVNMLISSVVTKKQVNAGRLMIRDNGKLTSTTLAGISMIETIKAAGAENGFFEKWAGYQASANEGTYESDMSQNTIGTIPTIFSAVCSNVILAIGLYLTMKGEFTIGMITAFQGYLQSFMGPAGNYITAYRNIQNMQTEMDRVDDVMNYPLDPLYEGTGDEKVTDAAKGTDAGAQNESKADSHGYAKLSGNVVLKDVTFGYSRLAEPIIENFNMTLTPGSRVAFVGASGCGKSTLAKLISGLYQPWSGEITFDGKKITEIDRSVFTGSVAVVDQDIIIFDDTIKNNVRMWDASIEDFEVILAAKDAQMHDVITQREGGYDYKMVEGGSDFSGGQRQRLEIARVLAQDPTICILDEATSALDAKTEFEVVNAIKDRGITCIIVAHRLSTIRDCDEIIVLDGGKVVERGTHDELMKLGGYYTQLVTND